MNGYKSWLKNSLNVQKIPVNVIIVRRAPQPDSRRFYSLGRKNASGATVVPHLKYPENAVNDGLLAVR
jgi:hypothetical protein